VIVYYRATHDCSSSNPLHRESSNNQGTWQTCICEDRSSVWWRWPGCIQHDWCVHTQKTVHSSSTLEIIISSISLIASMFAGNGGHYCENVGRDHRNNYVYYVANFSRLLLAQKCHDPDCARYRYDVKQLCY
jgi:hypothetical protein